MIHDEMCPIPESERMPDSTYCLWCEVIARAVLREKERLLTNYQVAIAEARADALKEARGQFAEAWSRDSHAVRFNKAGDDLTPHGRVLKWIRTVEL